MQCRCDRGLEMEGLIRIGTSRPTSTELRVQESRNVPGLGNLVELSLLDGTTSAQLHQCLEEGRGTRGRIELCTYPTNHRLSKRSTGYCEEQKVKNTRPKADVNKIQLPAALVRPMVREDWNEEPRA
jgi:hypothetical protein